MKKKDQEQWKSLIAAQESSGKSMKRWCRENDITESQYSYWKKKIKAESSNANEGRFLLVGEPKGLEIVIGGRIRIVVSRGFDRDLLREVLETLSYA
jgi:transposase-like protein